MTTEKELMKREGGHYYVDGRSVFKSPITHTYSDGTIGMQMGFMVCECNEYVDGAAEEIVKALNFYEDHGVK